MPAPETYRCPPISKALICPQHSSQVSRRNASSSARVIPVRTSRCIQYRGNSRPSTTTWKCFIVRPGLRPAARAASAALRWHASRCLVMLARLNSPLAERTGAFRNPFGHPPPPHGLIWFFFPECSTGAPGRQRDRVKARSGLLWEVGNQSLTEGCLLDLLRRVADIDDEPVHFQHPDQGVLIEHGRSRPVWVHGIHPQQIADLLGFGLHGRGTHLEIFPDLAGRNMGSLGGIEEKVDHPQRMDDPTGPDGGLASHQRRWAFATQGGCELPTELSVLLIQVRAAERISEVGNLLEARLHVLGNVL